MLRYLTIAPRKFTVNPINKRRENEKKMQNIKNGDDLTPFVRQNRNKRNKNNKKAVSKAAAIERICFTSPGCGRNVVDTIALGAFIKKLPTVGFNSGDSKPEFPWRVLNDLCLSTTACGKSRAGDI